MAKSKERGRFKAFLRKNTFIVVFAVAVVIAVTNYLVYPVFISKSLDLKEIPVATEEIKEGTKIMPSMISTVSVSNEILTSNIVLDEGKIIGSYVKEGSSIPAGSFFYNEVLCSKEEKLGETYSNLLEGEYAYPLPIDGRFDLDDTLKKGQFVDIYFYSYTSMKDPINKDLTLKDAPVFGILKEKARIIDISSDSDTRYIVLALNEEDLMYFNLAGQINAKSGGEIYPLVSFASSGDSEYESIYYDEDALRNWLKEKGKAFTYSESVQNARYVKFYGKKDDVQKEGEVISDGGDNE